MKIIMLMVPRGSTIMCYGCWVVLDNGIYITRLIGSILKIQRQIHRKSSAQNHDWQSKLSTLESTFVLPISNSHDLQLKNRFDSRSSDPALPKCYDSAFGNNTEGRSGACLLRNLFNDLFVRLILEVCLQYFLKDSIIR